MAAGMRYVYSKGGYLIIGRYVSILYSILYLAPFRCRPSLQGCHFRICLRTEPSE